MRGWGGRRGRHLSVATRPTRPKKTSPPRAGPSWSKDGNHRVLEPPNNQFDPPILFCSGVPRPTAGPGLKWTAVDPSSGAKGNEWTSAAGGPADPMGAAPPAAPPTQRITIDRLERASGRRPTGLGPDLQKPALGLEVPLSRKDLQGTAAATPVRLKARAGRTPATPRAPPANLEHRRQTRLASNTRFPPLPEHRGQDLIQ